MPRDIVITWPKSRPLQSYLETLETAVVEGHLINYRVSRVPTWDDTFTDHGWTGWFYGQTPPCCYVVHSGWVRGWTPIAGTCYRQEGEVKGWPAGWYIVREPKWTPLESLTPIPGFRGWRWFSP